MLDSERNDPQMVLPSWENFISDALRDVANRLSRESLGFSSSVAIIVFYRGSIDTTCQLIKHLGWRKFVAYTFGADAVTGNTWVIALGATLPLSIVTYPMFLAAGYALRRKLKRYKMVIAEISSTISPFKTEFDAILSSELSNAKKQSEVKFVYQMVVSSVLEKLIELRPKITHL